MGKFRLLRRIPRIPTPNKEARTRLRSCQMRVGRRRLGLTCQVDTSTAVDLSPTRLRHGPPTRTTQNDPIQCDFTPILKQRCHIYLFISSHTICFYRSFSHIHISRSCIYTHPYATHCISFLFIYRICVFN